MSYPVIGFVSCPTRDMASVLARKIIEARLAACVNIVPQVDSIYYWENKIQEDQESLLMIKSQSEKIEDLKQIITQNHPYQVPELITLKIQDGLPLYLKWIAESVSSIPPSGK